MVRGVNRGFEAKGPDSSEKTEKEAGKENIQNPSDKAADKVGKENLGLSEATTIKRRAPKPLADSQNLKKQKSSTQIASRGVESVRQDANARKAKSAKLPTKKQMETATYRPFVPGAAQQDDSEVSLGGLDTFSEKREMGTGTANTVWMYRTTIDGQDFFVKRVDAFVAQGTAAIDKVAQRLGLEPHMLAATYIENPENPKTAFLLTPMLEQVHDVETEVLTKSLGDSSKDFLARMAIFDHIISNTDRSNFKQLMESEGRIYLADNDNSLEQTNLDFESRTGGHIIELFADDLGIDHRELPVPKDLIAAAESMTQELDRLVESFTDEEERENVKNSLQKGLEGIIALREIDTPTLGDLYDMSPLMDKLMGY